MIAWADLPAVQRMEADSLKRIAARLGRKGGKSKSEAKQAASRENGKKGGRPVKPRP